MSTIGDVLSGRAQWCALEADCADVLPMLPPRSVGHVIADPPYSANVHALQRRLKMGSGGKATGGAHVVRSATLGFEHLTPDLRRLCATQAVRLATRWLLMKCDMEGQHGWQTDLERAGGRHVRFGVWWKQNAQPQLTGDRPGQGVEGVEVAHVRGERIRWNGGGMHGRWIHPVATDRNRTGERVHTTQTPLPLWLEIVEQFTDPGEIVLDPFMGSGSLGIACVRLGRRYIGMDNGHNEAGRSWASVAREGIEAEGLGISRGAHVRGQGSLFGPATHP